MIAIYIRNDDGTLKRRVERMSRDAYLTILREEAAQYGVHAHLAEKFEAGSQEELMGWPESKVTWYGTAERIGIAECDDA